MTVRRLGVLTSGGDAPGMNAALRAVVRTALAHGIEVYAVHQGYRGLIAGGEHIHPLRWNEMGGILHQGGTIIGTARSRAFLTREGRLQAARNVIAHRMDALVIIGGDGSLTGAHVFSQEWADLVAALREGGDISPEEAERHRHLLIAGVPGSIDNDLVGTDMSIGVDTALHRIAAAVDAISSTAASHQRTFVVEVMGRGCGYLALMGALATGADWVFIPEYPPEPDRWQEEMCAALRAGRAAGRRDSIVIVAEGARDRNGTPIRSEEVKQALERHLGEEARLTVLGHVQRGGSPSAFDRNLGTRLGHGAVAWLRAAPPDAVPHFIGLRGNRVEAIPLAEVLAQTRAVEDAIAAREYERALELRGASFHQAFHTFHKLVRAVPQQIRVQPRPLRLAVMHAGAPAPGMNAAVRAAVRFALDEGHTVLGVRNAFRGLIRGDLVELAWMSVKGWTTIGGADLGTNRTLPEEEDFYRIARVLEEHRIDGLLIIGGWWAYEGAYRLYTHRHAFPAFRIPVVCVPATIDNNLPGTDFSIGVDTALNNIVWAVDRIKQSAVATQRVFVVEVMGRDCGYLALMSGMATGAERVYLPEEGVTLAELETDLQRLIQGFRQGKRLGLIIRNETANPVYTTSVISAILQAESSGLYDVRYAILGHLQQGGDPSPFDRILATRLAADAMTHLMHLAARGDKHTYFAGLQQDEVRFHNLAHWPEVIHESRLRPQEQWWMDVRPVASIMAQPGPPSAARVG